MRLCKQVESSIKHRGIQQPLFHYMQKLSTSSESTALQKQPPYSLSSKERSPATYTSPVAESGAKETSKLPGLHFVSFAARRGVEFGSV